MWSDRWWIRMAPSSREIWIVFGLGWRIRIGAVNHFTKLSVFIFVCTPLYGSGIRGIAGKSRCQMAPAVADRPSKNPETGSPLGLPDPALALQNLQWGP